MSRSAEAQVNTENLRKRIKSVGYSFILEGSFTGDVGNTQGLSTGGGIGGGWGHEPHLIFAYARADYGKYSGVTSVDKTFAHVRYNYELKPWAWGEVFAQAQSDAFQRLTLRNLFGAGPRARLAHDPASGLDIYAGTAYMFERDAIDAAPGTTGSVNQSIQTWHRWSNYVTAQWQADERVIMATTFYFQPAFTDFTNILALSETLFTFKVTKVFAANLSGVLRYDSHPPTTVLPTDLEIKNTLSVTF